MKLLYGTGNRAKLMAMQRRLEALPIEIIGLKPPIPEVPEDGATPLENARQKAEAYYRAYGVPVFSCDSAMYMEGLPDTLQPGVHARRVGGKTLSDQEMIDYYSGLVKQYGRLKTRYRNAICLIMDAQHIYESMDESLASNPFLISDQPHRIRKQGFPIDSLSIDIATGKYLYDLDEGALDQIAVEEGFLTFFQEVLRQYVSEQ
jgi:8-oxo-dGTP diphosphatase